MKRQRDSDNDRNKIVSSGINEQAKTKVKLSLKRAHALEMIN